MDVDSALAEISQLQKKRQYDLVEERCNLLLAEELSDQLQTEVLRVRSSNYIFMSDYLSAYFDRLTILDGENYETGDFFFAALYAIRQRKECESIELIDRGIAFSIEKNNFYYHDSLCFLKAFSLIKVGDFLSAESILANVADGFQLWITRPDKPHTKEELLEMIANG